jgi:hypothetical protein
MTSDCSTAFIGGNIALESYSPGNGLDWNEIDPNDQAIRWHSFCCDLAP